MKDIRTKKYCPILLKLHRTKACHGYSQNFEWQEILIREFRAESVAFGGLHFQNRRSQLT